MEDVDVVLINNAHEETNQNDSSLVFVNTEKAVDMTQKNMEETDTDSAERGENDIDKIELETKPAEPSAYSESNDSISSGHASEHMDTSSTKERKEATNSTDNASAIPPLHLKIVCNEVEKSLSLSAEIITLADLEKMIRSTLPPKESSRCQLSLKVNDEFLPISSTDKTLVEAGILQNSIVFIKFRNPGGICGLNNLGNTCFMNSALQCLSNIQPLTEYFLSLNIHRDQRAPPTGGDATKAYAELIEQLWLGTKSPADPGRVKHVIGSQASRFNGFSQQDSHEFMNLLLNVLHEEIKNTDDTSFYNSPIAKIFHGQLRTTIQCATPQCIGQPEYMYTLITFLPLPLSMPNAPCVYSIDYIRLDGQCERIDLQGESRTVGDLIDRFVEYENKIDDVKEKKKASYEASASSDHHYHHPEAELILATVIKDNVLEHELDPTTTLRTLSQRSLVFYQLPLLLKTGDHKRLIWCLFSTRECARYFHPPMYIAVNKINTTKEDLRIELQTLLLKVFPFLSKVTLVETQTASASSTSLKHKNSCTKVIFVLKSMDAHTGDIEIQVDSMQDVSKLTIFVTQKLITQWEQKNCRKIQLSASSLIPTTHQSADQDHLNLADCLKEFFAEETMGGNNGQWYCSRCNRLTDARKKLDLSRISQVLIIQLKRFTYEGSASKKIDTFVKFPHHLDISEFIVSDSVEKTNAEYQLVAVSNHSGSLRWGHYTSTAKNFQDGNWYQFNDSQVSITDESTVVTRNAYILVYVNTK